MRASTFGLCFAVACSAGPPASSEQVEAGAETPRQLRPAFCARMGDDAVRDVFCAPSSATLRSLDELLVALNLKPPPAAGGDVTEMTDRTPYSVAVLGHSTALSGRLVSPINPRVIVMGTESFLAFQRGTQQVELIARARDGSGLSFYLIEFEQACNPQPAGCAPGDLYTPRIEFDWLKASSARTSFLTCLRSSRTIRTSARRGLQTEPDASPEDVLIQACGSCHNDILDQSVTRARFNIRVSALDRQELDIAIERLQRPSNDPGAMPPPTARALDQPTRERLIEYLRADPVQLDQEGRLDHASRIGMTRGSGQRRSVAAL